MTSTESKSGFLSRLNVASCFKAALVAICISVTLERGLECLRRYAKERTSQTFEVLSAGQVPFPAMTICPSYSAAYNLTAMQELGISGKKDYKNGNFYGDARVRSPAVGKEIFEKVTYSLSEVFHRVEYHTEDTGDAHHIVFPFDEREMSERDLGKWQVKEHTFYGRCYSLEISKAISSAVVRTVTFETRLSTFIYLHYPGQYFTELHSRVFTHLGRKYFLEVDFTILNDALGGQDGNCRPDLTRAFDRCLNDRVRAAMLSKMNCTVPWVMEPLICDEKFENGSKSSAYRLYYDLRVKNLTVLCPRPCSKMNFQFGWPDEEEGEQDRGFIRMTFDALVERKTTIQDYSWLSMVAEIGGYVGLLLGVSVVDLASLVIEPIVHALKDGARIFAKR